jgi:hypothetical protein
MPCPDRSSGFNIRLDSRERFVKFDFAKITCCRETSGSTGLSEFCAGRSLEEILDLDFQMLVEALDLNADEERQFILYMELNALKAAIAQFLGIEHSGADANRCQVTGVQYGDGFMDITLVILPPKSFPVPGP